MPCWPFPARTSTATAKEPRPQRKIGHVTVVGADEHERDERLAAVRSVVRRASSP